MRAHAHAETHGLGPAKIAKAQNARDALQTKARMKCLNKHHLSIFKGHRKYARINVSFKEHVNHVMPAD